MNFKEFSTSFNQRRQAGPVNVEFVSGVEDLEAYPEAGMRATITSVIRDHDDEDVFIVGLDFTEHDEFNKAFESTNYFDRNGNPTLTAREAGCYLLKENIYVMSSDETTKYFNLIDRSPLYQKYLDEKPSVSYVEWLERLVTQEG